MKKRFLPIATAISAAALLAACSQTELIDDGSVKNNGTADNNAVTFSTYTAKNGGTRAGYEGNMTNDALQSGKDGNDYNGGFGVFAYYTGEATPDGTYNDYRGDGKNVQTSNTKYANFMYNQLVTFETNSWTYTPLKYWPNDFQKGAVDGQTPPAQGSGNHGNVSFFAYAPYVKSDPASGMVVEKEETTGTTKWEADTKGITQMTSNKQPGDPRIHYTLGSNVDLLWGTLDPSTGKNVLGQGNIGRSYGTGSTYESDIREGYSVAADLTKQKIDGQVKFKFIHALAGIGGSTESVGGTEAEKETKSGFKVILDIDDNGNAASGGTRETFDVDADNNEKPGAKYYRTIVTLKSVSITNNLDGDNTVEAGNGSDQEEERLFNSGVLNLATGQWTDADGESLTLKDEDTGEFGQIVGKTESNSTLSPYKMNPDIAEYDEEGNSYFNVSDGNASTILPYFLVTQPEDDGKAKGVVETEAKNVYKDADVPPILLIPGQTPKFRVNVVYVVRQYDEKLANKYTVVENNITKIVTFPKMEMNTHYTIIMRLGLTGVKFYAQVADWTPKGDNVPDTDPVPGGDTSDTQDDVEILLPSNEPNPMNNN